MNEVANHQPSTKGPMKELTIRATRDQFCKLGRKLAGLKFDRARLGYFPVSGKYPPFGLISLENHRHQVEKVRYYRPEDIQYIRWQRPDKVEDIVASRQMNDEWELIYTGPAEFENQYFQLLVDAVPKVNACAAIFVKLVQSAQFLVVRPKDRESLIIKWAYAIATAPSVKEALRSIDHEAATGIQRIPEHVFAQGWLMLRGHLLKSI